MLSQNLKRLPGSQQRIWLPKPLFKVVKKLVFNYVGVLIGQQAWIKNKHLMLETLGTITFSRVNLIVSCVSSTCSWKKIVVNSVSEEL